MIKVTLSHCSDSTNKEPVSRVRYSVVYGWQFADAYGYPVDSSFFAEFISTDAAGGLQLTSLSAPDHGNFPMKIRCEAYLATRLATGDLGATRTYTSDYITLSIKRPDGSETEPDPSKPIPDGMNTYKRN